jgi:uncharacterized protein YwqG
VLLHVLVKTIEVIGTMVLVMVGFVVLAFTMAAIGELAAWLGGRRRDKDPMGSDGARIRARMTRMSRSTLLLIPTKTPGFSKLGGAPDLLSGPVSQALGPGAHAFLAQIDLKEVREGGGPEWLPDEGRLYAFHAEGREGSADQVRVIFRDAAQGDAATSPADDLSATARFSERRAGFLSMPSIPSLDWLGVDLHEIDVSDRELDELADAPDEPFGDELQHRIGGYPSELQSEQMGLSCEYMRRGLERRAGDEVPDAILRASKAWRLLLQIDSDPALEMNWGDAGRLYVFVREQDARKGDFSKTVTIDQTY